MFNNEEYEKDECYECGRYFYLEDLTDGICDSCADKLAREYARDVAQLEMDYWSSQF